MHAICIKCWDPEALVKMHLDGSGAFECAECEESFTCEEVRGALDAMQKGWGKLIRWAESYPKDVPA